MNEKSKTAIIQKLDKLSDQAGRQLLDYIEFLESKFNRSTRERSTFERLAENVEGTLRSSKIGEAAVKGTGEMIDVAGAVARSFAAAGQAVLDELQHAVAEEPQKTEQADKADTGSEEEAYSDQSTDGPEEPKGSGNSPGEESGEGEKTSA